jgi:hypothetical protein
MNNLYAFMPTDNIKVKAAFCNLTCHRTIFIVTINLYRLGDTVACNYRPFLHDYYQKMAPSGSHSDCICVNLLSVTVSFAFLEMRQGFILCRTVACPVVHIKLFDGGVVSTLWVL